MAESVTTNTTSLGIALPKGVTVRSDALRLEITARTEDAVVSRGLLALVLDSLTEEYDSLGGK
jgi:hypothetical protein